MIDLKKIAPIEVTVERRVDFNGIAYERRTHYVPVYIARPVETIVEYIWRDRKPEYCSFCGCKFVANNYGLCTKCGAPKTI